MDGSAARGGRLGPERRGLRVASRGLALALTVGALIPSHGRAGRPASPSELRREAQPNDGRLGLRFADAPEGLLVTEVEPGRGAAAAGITVGTFIVSINGAPPPASAADRMAALRGPVGSVVTLQVQGPLDAPLREVAVTRGPAGAAGGASAGTPKAVAPQTPAVVQDFREAMRGRSPRRAARATRRLIAADWGGMSPVAAVGAGLTVAASAPKVASAAAAALWTARPTHPTLLQRMAEALVAGGETALAIEVLDARRAALAPELWLADGRAVRTGSSSLRADGLRVEALVAEGRRSEATDALREMLPFAEVERLAGLVGMAQAPRAEPWRAQVPPVAPFSLELADGGTWRLDGHAGDVRVLNFWATWCGPCKRELPELSRLREAMPRDDLHIVAISVDEGLAPTAVAEAAASMGARLPVAVAPPGLAATLGVQAIPALRVIGRDGAVRYAARGFSENSMVALRAEIEAALADDAAAGVELARPWGAGSARLRSFIPMTGLGSVAVGPGVVALGAARGGPAVARLDGGSASEADLDAPGPATHLQWLGGPVGVDAGLPVLRALDADGAPRWARGLAEPVRATAVADGGLWVQTESELMVLSAEGAVLARRPSDAVAISPALPSGGVYAVDGQTRRHVALRDGGMVETEVVQRPGAQRVTAGGAVGDAGTFDLVAGRFGPDGAWRVALTRRDAGLLVLDGQGVPAVAAKLPAPAGLGAADVDGDGRDELLVRLDGRGLAVVTVVVP